MMMVGISILFFISSGWWTNKVYIDLEDYANEDYYDDEGMLKLELLMSQYCVLTASGQK